MTTDPAPTAGRDLAGPAMPDRVLALLDAVTAADGVAPVGEVGLLAIRHRTAEARHRWLAVDGELVGYAQIDPTGSAELCVAPDHRRRGLGGALLATLLDEEPQLSVWSHGDLPAARALADRAGLRITRELWQMSLALPAAGRPSRSTPADAAARTFVVGQDEDRWVALNSRAFADHPEQGRLTADDVRQREAEDWFDPTLLWLGHEAGRPDALLASMWVKAVPGEDDGEIYALGVDPAAQGRGLGGWLTDLALDEMARRGLTRATLYVEGDNTAAIRTYRRAGFDRSAVDIHYSR
ncbi:mycothiol synthase [Georgenia sp. MJ170]|uniref:mycothiol synthase n=1 Tax=Georgenia sunbinii TaxID=3117728 RepID=UPI002F2654EF